MSIKSRCLDYLTAVFASQDRRKDGGDTLLVRKMVSAGSLMWGAILLGNVLYSGHFLIEYDQHDFLTGLMPLSWWGTLFLIHGIIGLLSSVRRWSDRSLIFFDSILGAALWSISGSLSVAEIVGYKSTLHPMFIGHVLLAYGALISLIKNSYGR